MLAQKNFYRRDAETQRSLEKGSGGEREKTRPFPPSLASLSPRLPFSSSPLLILVIVAIALLAGACGSKPTDPRTVIPNDALVYLESSDLGRTLGAITGNEKFQQLTDARPDLSALSGVKVSIAVTGFETSEQTVTEENSVLNFRPHVVAVVETNAWGWQTSSFVENQLGEFINDTYGGEVELETVPTNDGGTRYVWNSPDGRKAFALQQGSLVFFGNDETAIDRCQAVRRGEIESIAKNPKIADAGDRLAFGYISPDGVGQISNITGISLAMGASEEDEVKSFVARVLPEILRNSIKDVTWTATANEAGIEDKVVITLDDESSRVFSETIVPATSATSDLAAFVPASAMSTTRYLLRDPQIAWRSAVLTARKKTDETSGNLIVAFSGSLFEPYGIEDPELFLQSVGSPLITTRLTGDSEDAVVIAPVKDAAKIKSSIAKEVNFGKAPERIGDADVWRSEDGEVAAIFLPDKVIVGDAETALKCLEARQGQPNSDMARRLSASDAVSISVVNESESGTRLVSVFAQPKAENQRIVLSYSTETRFNRNGIERRTISDFGLIGSVIELLVKE